MSKNKPARGISLYVSLLSELKHRKRCLSDAWNFISLYVSLLSELKLGKVEQLTENHVRISLYVSLLSELKQNSVETLIVGEHFALCLAIKRIETAIRALSDLHRGGKVSLYVSLLSELKRRPLRRIPESLVRFRFMSRY